MRNISNNKFFIALLALAMFASCAKPENDTAKIDDSEMAYVRIFNYLENDEATDEHNQDTGVIESPTLAPTTRAILSETAIENYKRKLPWPGIHSSYSFAAALAVTKVGGTVGDPANKYAPEYYNLFMHYFSNANYGPTSLGLYLSDGMPNQDDLVLGSMPLYKSAGQVQLSGYHPYDPSVTDVRNVHFDIREGYFYSNGSFPTLKAYYLAKCYDYLWFPPITINPASSTTASLVWKHAMSRLDLLFNPMGNMGTDFTIGKIVYETVDGGNWLPVKGTMDATTGKLSVTEYTNKIELQTGRSISTLSTPYPTDYNMTNVVSLMIPQIALTSGQGNRKIKISLYANMEYSVDYWNYTYPDRPQIAQEPLIEEPFIVDLAAFNISGSNYGLRTGYRYSVWCRYDNHTKFVFDAIPEAEPWNSETVDITI